MHQKTKIKLENKTDIGASTETKRNETRFKIRKLEKVLTYGAGD